MPGVLYWRLSSLYLIYFAVVGIISPYWGLYLDHLGFTTQQMGVVLALPMLTKMIAPNLWGWWADHSGRYVLVMRLGAAGAVLGVIGLLGSARYWPVLLFTALFTFFWNAILPQFEVITLDSLGKNTQKYSQIRVWGSIGFIAASTGLGWYFGVYGMGALPVFLFVFLLFILLSTLGISEPHKAGLQPSQIAEAASGRRLMLAVFLSSAFLLHASHGVYYGFYSLYLSRYGYSTGLIGVLWSLGVVAEILLFLRMPWVLARLSLWACLCASVVAAAVRWWLIGWYPEQIAILLFAQLLHALTFALAHAVAIEMIRRLFPGHQRGFGQALYSALCFGAGGALGIYVCGVLWSVSMRSAFGFSCALVMIAVVVMALGVRVAKQHSLSV